MAILSIKQFNLLTENIEKKLNEADEFANFTKKRLEHDEVFENIRSNLNEKQ